MKSSKEFLKATLVGGVMFLVPVVLLLVVLGKALQFAGTVAQPIARMLPVSHMGGVAVATLIAAAILLLIALLAGLAARTQPGRRVTHWFEESILGGIPQYRMVKSMAEGLTQIESGAGLQPILMRDAMVLVKRLGIGSAESLRGMTLDADGGDRIAT